MTCRTRPIHRLQAGVSLVELMVAMTLGLLLLSGMIAVFSGNQRSAELNTAMANLQESARFALSRLSKDIRLAGYQGCLNPNVGRMSVRAVNSPIAVDGVDINGQPNYVPELSSSTGAVVQADGTWEPAIPGGLLPPALNPAIPGTHVLSVQYGSSNFSRIDPNNINSNAGVLNNSINTEFNLLLTQGDLALVGNCNAVDLIEVTAAPFLNNGQALAHDAGRNINGNVSLDYTGPLQYPTTKVMRYMTRVYYIGDTGIENEQGDQIRALYLQTYPFNDPTNPPSEIVQGVENMRISYGQRNGNSLMYVTADNPTFNPSNVESIQVGLIMASWDHIAEQDDENTYVIAGQSIEPSDNPDDAFTHAQDGRYRLVFNTTVKVRNQRL